MAEVARRDIQKRMTEVDRQKLLKVLIHNRKQHVQDYQEAMAGYKATLLDKIEQAFDDARLSLDKKHARLVGKVQDFSDDDISEQSDHFVLVDSIHVTMPVPRSFESEYDAAIAMAEWDVRPVLELTHAEFTCFVRDKWDWQEDTKAVFKLYSGKL